MYKKERKKRKKNLKYQKRTSAEKKEPRMEGTPEGTRKDIGNSRIFPVVA